MDEPCTIGPVPEEVHAEGLSSGHVHDGVHHRVLQLLQAHRLVVGRGLAVGLVVGHGLAVGLVVGQCLAVGLVVGQCLAVGLIIGHGLVIGHGLAVGLALGLAVGLDVRLGVGLVSQLLSDWAIRLVLGLVDRHRHVLVRWRNSEVIEV